jgi:predicted ATPase
VFNSKESEQTPWLIHLLGGLRCEREGEVLNHFRTRRAAALLGYLALFLHRTHPRETLIEFLWPDSAPDTARARLRQELYSLRRQLEPVGVPSGSVLIANRFDVRLNPEMVQTDVARLEVAVQRSKRSTPIERRQLLDPYLGEQHPGQLLPGFYDDWVLVERERITELVDTAIRLYTEAQATQPDTPPSDTPNSLTIGDILREKPTSEVRLPMVYTAFFGRSDEITQIQQSLTGETRNRLVTITGTGGIGKTRLALESARSITSFFPGGIFFVPLAETMEPVRVPLAMQQALRLPPAEIKTTIEEQVIGVLAQREPTLLVLDNVEHLLTTAKARNSLNDFLMTLWERAPNVCILATSRRRLDLPGERIIALNSLLLPSQNTDLNDIANMPSIGLFVNRAKSVRPDFTVTEQNASHVIQLCRRLDALPLAIELVAARAATLSPAQMLEQLRERREGGLEMLSRLGRTREQGGRHHSLQTTMQWSHNLLSPQVQRILAHLSIFAGGWTVALATTVLEEPDLITALEELCANSLVQSRESEDGTLRFFLLETQREFERKYLSKEKENTLLLRLAHWYTDQLKHMRAQYGIPTNPAQLLFIQTEYPNIRAALDWCCTNNRIMAWELAAQLFVFWLVRGQYTEGLDWLNSLLLLDDASSALADVTNEVKTLYARLQVSRGAFLLMLGRSHEVLSYNEQAAALLESLPDRNSESEEWLGWAYYHIAVYYYSQRDYRTADAWNQKALVCMQRSSEVRNVGAVLYRLSQCAYSSGNIAKAEALIEEALSYLRGDDDFWQGYALTQRALIAIDQEDYQAARRYFEDSLFHLKRIPSAPQYADTEMELAILERELGNLQRSHEIGVAALQIFSATGARFRAAQMLCHLAQTALYSEDYNTAENFAADAARLMEERKDTTGMGLCQILRGHITLEREGDVVRAARLIQRGLIASWHTPFKQEQIPYAVRLLAECAVQNNHPYPAGILLGTIQNLQKRHSQQIRMLPRPKAHYEKTRLAVLQTLGEDTFGSAFAEGVALSKKAALSYLTEMSFGE